MGLDRWRAAGASLSVAMVVAVVAACGAFGGEGDPTAAPPEAGSADGGDTSVGGEAAADVVLELPKDLVLVHGQTLAVDVKIKRKPPFAGGVTVSVTGLPTDLGCASVDVTPFQSTAALSFVVGKNVVQGALKNVSIEARAGTVVAGSAPLIAFVRGASGELDTTFATNGIISVPQDSNRLAMRTDGGFYLLQTLGNRVVRKFTKDGVLDKSFATGGLYDPGAATPMTSMALKEPFLFLAGTGDQPGANSNYVRKLDGIGQVVQAYGTAGTYAEDYTGNLGSRGVAIGPSSEAVFVGGEKVGADYYAYARFATSTGTRATASDNGLYVAIPPDGFNAVVHEGPTTVQVGGSIILRLNAVTHKKDLTFGTAGVVTVTLVPAANLTSIAKDGSGNYVVGGSENNFSQLFVTRLRPNGSGDPTFGISGEFHPSVALGAGGGAIAVSGAKIVQVATVSNGTLYHCEVLRYTSVGDFDTSFGDNGRSILPMEDCYVGDVAVQSDGRIVVAGSKPFRVWN